MRHGAVMAALFALLMVVGQLAAATAQPGNFWGWEGLAGVALITVLFLLSIGYMASVVLSDEKLNAWVKKEVGQVFFSAIILVVTISLVASLDPMLKNVSKADGITTQNWQGYVNTVCCDAVTPGNCMVVRNRACHIELATDYLQFLYDTLRQDAVTYLDNYWNYGFLSNLSFNVSFLLDEKSGGLELTPFAGLSMAADYFSMLFELAVKMMMLVRAQQIFLDYIWYAIFPVFLSMGLILRLLYFTRKLGGLLIAIAICAYVVFPMFYVVSSSILFDFLGGAQANWHAFGMVYNETQTPPPGQTAQGATGSTQGTDSSPINIDLCSQNDSNSSTTALGNDIAQNWGGYVHTGWFSQVLSFFSNGVPSSGFGTGGPLAQMATIMVFALITPFLALMTTLASVKVLSPLLGGDVEISVLSRLI